MTSKYIEGDRVIALKNCFALVNGIRTRIAVTNTEGEFVKRYSGTRAIIRWRGQKIQAPHSYDNFKLKCNG